MKMRPARLPQADTRRRVRCSIVVRGCGRAAARAGAAVLRQRGETVRPSHGWDAGRANRLKFTAFLP